MVFTALGDAVNVASRLQDMTKTFGCEAIVSEEFASPPGSRPMPCPSAKSPSAAAASR